MSERRLLQLDGLRCIAFLAVFLHRAFNVPLLWAGVDLFFVLSGYLITGILIRSKELSLQHHGGYFRVFYLRRLLRIAPPYYLFLAVFVLLTNFTATQHISPYLFYVNNFNDAFKWQPIPEGLSPMWSLAIEEQFYLLWPLLVWMLNSRQMVWLSVGLIFIAPVCRMVVAVSSPDHAPAYYLLPCRIDLLSAGCLLALAQAQLSAERFLGITRYGLVAALAAAVAFFACGGLLPGFRTAANSLAFNGLGYSLILVIATGTIAYLIPRGDGALGRLLSQKPLVFIGAISYTLYLTHAFVLSQVKVMGWSTPLTGAAALALTVVTATISWYGLEYPLQRLKSRIAPYTGQPKPAPAIPNPSGEVS